MTDVRDESGSRRLVEELAPRLCNWDRWDRHDGVGALNLVTPAKRLEASAAVRSGEAFSLGPIDAGTYAADTYNPAVDTGRVIIINPDGSKEELPDR